MIGVYTDITGADAANIMYFFKYYDMSGIF